MDPLTRKQQDVLHFIADARSAKGASPTLQEIASAFKVCIGTVQSHVRALQRKGYIGVDPNQHRGIRLSHGRGGRASAREDRGSFEAGVGSKLTQAPDLPRLFAVVAEDLKTWLGIDAADLLIYDPGRRELRGADYYAAQRPGGGTAPKPEALGDTLCGEAVRRRRPASASLAKAASAFTREATARPGILACAGIPVLGRDRVLGVLRLDDRRDAARFDDALLARAGMAAAALAPVIEQGALHTELQRRITVQSALIALCRTIHTGQDLRRTLLEFHDIVKGLVDAPVFYIAVKDDAGEWWLLLQTDVVDGKPWVETTPENVIVGKHEAIRTLQSQPYYIRHRTPEEIHKLEDLGPGVPGDGWYAVGNVRKRSRSILYVPLKTGGEMIGYISAQTYAYNAYSIRDAEDLMLIGEYIGLAVQNAMRRDRERAKLETAEAIMAKAAGIEGELRVIAAGLQGEGRSKIEGLIAELGALRGT